MARVPGRSAWLAWPVGVVCAAAVVALLWLSAPILPAVATWSTDMFRAAVAPPEEAPVEAPRASVLETVASGEDLDCRRFYPTDLWTELTWNPQAFLQQDRGASATSVVSLGEALAPQVRMSCRWTLPTGATISTTLAQVAEGAGAVAEATLGAEGFSCATQGAVLACTRERGGVLEEHALSGDLWLSSVETGVVPEEYGSRLVGWVWPAG